MDNRYSGAIGRRIVEALCLSTLCAIAIAGLWPFHAPKNGVNWLENGNGLHFGRHGSIVSAAAFPANGPKDDPSCSLEVWLAPGQIDGAHTILDFDGSGNPRVSLSLKQYFGGLVLQRHPINPDDDARKQAFGVEGVFREQGQPVFVTVASGSQNTSVYVDGVLAGATPTFRLSSEDLTGQLVVAGSTTGGSWFGEVRGLAIYHRQLTPAQILEHYESWVKKQRPALAGDQTPVALYLFNEHGGNVVGNQLDHTTDLIIPTHYFVLHSHFLQFPWNEYLPGWSYWEDVSINIAGFIPLGFFFGAYFSAVRKTNRPVAAAVALGFCVSLTIETLQTFLPTRSSGMTDIINNTLGTAIGALLYSCSLGQALLRRAGPYGITNLFASPKQAVGGLT
jgi:VanZ family protein